MRISSSALKLADQHISVREEGMNFAQENGWEDAPVLDESLLEVPLLDDEKTLDGFLNRRCNMICDTLRDIRSYGDDSDLRLMNQYQNLQDDIDEVSNVLKKHRAHFDDESINVWQIELERAKKQIQQEYDHVFGPSGISH